MATILPVPQLQDNYSYLIRDDVSGLTGVIDPSEAKPVLDALNQHGWSLHAVFSTHHHGDHTGGNLALQKATGCAIYGFSGDVDRIPGITHLLENNAVAALGQTSLTVIHIPGHTLGHIAYYSAHDQAVFCGDTLFSLGCGRLFEGTPEMMWESLCKLRDLPVETRVFCGHEYTLSNARFAASVEPDNEALARYYAWVQDARSHGQATIPSTIGRERETNPFFRPHSATIREHLEMMDASDLQVFAELRARKDCF